MALDGHFYRTVEPLKVAGMGTENVGPLLYSLVRMTRPERLLEVGLGYTSPFLAKALGDNLAEFTDDLALLEAGGGPDSRQAMLADAHYKAGYRPRLYAVDDYSGAGSSAPKVLEVLEALDLRQLVSVHRGDFRGYGRRVEPAALPLDFVWFDAGGLAEYVDFIAEYWPLINPNHGMLILHFTYWNIIQERDGVERARLVSGSIANELKRQQLAAGLKSIFEVMSLVEPHKTRQGSVTMVRKLTPTSMCRDKEFTSEVNEIFGTTSKPIIPL